MKVTNLWTLQVLILIEPVGIETMYHGAWLPRRNVILIEPVGIETLKMAKHG